jgi:hypothetical protein
MSVSFEIDASEIIAFGQRGIQASQMTVTALNKAGRASGLAVQRLAQSKAAVKSGTMKGRIKVDRVDATATSLLVRVVADAQSKAGFPYPRSIEYGRKGFSATRAKVLVFPVNGKIVYTKRVGPAAAQPFMRPALHDAEPFIKAAFKREYAALLKAWGG